MSEDACLKCGGELEDVKRGLSNPSGMPLRRCTKCASEWTGPGFKEWLDGIKVKVVTATSGPVCKRVKSEDSII